MARIADLPYELWNIIILMLVQSSDNSADLARIISVCRTFRTFTEDVSILKPVRFNNEIHVNNLHLYQNVNGLLVRCAEAGNTAARFLLGKVTEVLLLSYSQLISRYQNISVHRPSDRASFNRILGRYLYLGNRELKSFATYFVPQHASSSEASQTRLVHYQLVKVFLCYCSPRDMYEMGDSVMTYFKKLPGINEKEGLLDCLKMMVFCGFRFRRMEQLAEIKEELDYTLVRLNEMRAGVVERHSEDPSSALVPRDHEEYVQYCATGWGQLWSRYEQNNVYWQLVLTGDIRDINTQVEETYADFQECQSIAVHYFEAYYP